MAELIELVRPRFLVPVHGDEDDAGGAGAGSPSRAPASTAADVLLARNGDVVSSAPTGPRSSTTSRAEVVLADADGLPLEPR